MNNAITTLVGEELGGDDKWRGTLATPNGTVYGIPCWAGRVSKFNPIDKSITEIGPDFGDDHDYDLQRGAITDSGVIYCPLCDSRRHGSRGIVKIDTNTDTAIELDANLFPEREDCYFMWKSCAAALDGCIYFMPSSARRIMKLDPKNGDAMTSVGDDLGGGGSKYSGTVVGIDGCVYGIPFECNRIVKYDPINDTTSFVGEETDEYFYCSGGAMGRDGYIYVFARKGDRVLKIDTANNSHSYVGSSVQSGPWGDAVLGIDGCIYWPPNGDTRTLKYDPHSNQTLLVGGDALGNGLLQWRNGALAADGVIYCLPQQANRVLAIDPIGEFLAATKAKMQEHPGEFGSLFQIIEADEDSTLPTSLTNFDHAVLKFGHNKVFEILEKCIQPVDDYCEVSNLYPLVIAASCKESRVCVINHLLCRDLSWLNSCIGSLEGNDRKKKRRKL